MSRGDVDSKGNPYDEDNLESKPAAVGYQPVPINFSEADGVDKCGEETSATAKELEDCYAAGALGKGEQFNEEGYARLAKFEMLSVQCSKTYCMSKHCSRCCSMAGKQR